MWAAHSSWSASASGVWLDDDFECMQGQEWTTIEGLVEEGHHNKIQEIEPGGHDRVLMQEGSGRCQCAALIMDNSMPLDCCSYICRVLCTIIGL